MKGKEILVLVLLFIFVLSACAFAQNYQKILIHAHDTNSDGGLFEKDVVKKAKSLGAVHVFLTPHLPCVIGKCQDKKHAHIKENFSEKYYQNTFLDVSRCAEIYTDIHAAHILIIGNSFQNIYKNSDFINLGKEYYSAAYICRFAEQNNLISILAHPHDAYDSTAINRFDAIEFFNTRAYRLKTLDLFGVLEAPWIPITTDQQKDLNIYCQAIKTYLQNPAIKKIPAVVGGSDCHISTIELDYGYTNVNIIGPINTNSILLAIKDGRTFANMYGSSRRAIKINDLNFHPQKKPYQIIDNHITIKGKLKVPLRIGEKERLQIFCNGQLFEEQSIDSEQVDFEYIDDNITTDGLRIYFLYIPGRFITSPIIFDVNVDPNAPFENVLQKEVIHLGDDNFATPVNVGFVKKSQGIHFVKRFDLPKNIYQRQDGYIVVNLRGAEHSSLYLNNKVSWKLTNTLADNGKAQAFKIPQGVLTEKNNTVRIISQVVPHNPNDNDDIEFHNLTIYFGDISPYIVF